MKTLARLTLTSSLLLCSTYVFADDASMATAMDDGHITNVISRIDSTETAWIIDLGWDSKYISEGRNNLDNSGIYWATGAYQYDSLTVYASLGRGDSNNYIEWDLGLEYGFELTENLEAAVGYQRIQGYGDSDCRDNELFASLSYSPFEWLTPSLAYTYSTEAAGYFIEASVHSSWPITAQLTLTPYVTQTFDFQYVTEEHDGANHLQLGLEAEYQLQPQLVVSGHVSQTFAQQDIEQEAGYNNRDLDQTYFGFHLTWEF
ncbi:porin [Shewanella sp. Isolate11]|uniref:porin n=1 Tax=Shewanella sp. Isolate11 TaxID=2908530 RepID=UPI001EFC3739|nr:porin [Shewanella sp. Isolate11]MCG9697939.1 hypothetical protein [Shewanella sp. Isolate11]